MYSVYEYHKNDIPEGLEPLRSLEGVKLDLVTCSPAVRKANAGSPCNTCSCCHEQSLWMKCDHHLQLHVYLSKHRTPEEREGYKKCVDGMKQKMSDFPNRRRAIDLMQLGFCSNRAVNPVFTVLKSFECIPKLYFKILT